MDLGDSLDCSVSQVLLGHWEPGPSPAALTGNPKGASKLLKVGHDPVPPDIFGASEMILGQIWAS